MRFFTLRVHQVVIACCYLACTWTFLLDQVQGAPPSRQQASSRTWSKYARAMEPSRPTANRHLLRNPASQHQQTSWLDSLDSESVLVDNEGTPITTAPSFCQSCLTGCCSSHQRSCQTWVHLDYLLGWRKGQHVPALVTTSVDGTDIADAGQLGLASTSILLGNEHLVDGPRPGGRIDFGRWLANGETAIGGRFYALSDSSSSHVFDATTHSILARPFFNVVSGEQDALIVLFPGTDTGSIQVTSGASLSGGDIYLRQSWCQIGFACVDLITGYQFTQIDEQLHIQSTSTNQSVQSLEVLDQFDTRNVFHCGLLGLISETEGTCWSLTLLAKVGLGSTQETVRVDGTTVITDLSGGTNTISGGLLAKDSNIGTHTQDEFTVVPELNVRYTQHITECVDVSLGYTYIYWSKVVQPGDQIDMNIDTTPGATLPAMNMVSDDYWMQSLDFGITWWF
ncbi:MAG: BBP7 family outer membrane beta-barrel protein [Pirellulaceae bacterium]